MATPKVAPGFIPCPSCMGRNPNCMTCGGSGTLSAGTPRAIRKPVVATPLDPKDRLCPVPEDAPKGK